MFARVELSGLLALGSRGSRLVHDVYLHRCRRHVSMNEVRPAEASACRGIQLGAVQAALARRQWPWHLDQGTNGSPCHC